VQLLQVQQQVVIRVLVQIQQQVNVIRNLLIILQHDQVRAELLQAELQPRVQARIILHRALVLQVPVLILLLVHQVEVIPHHELQARHEVLIAHQGLRHQAVRLILHQGVHRLVVVHHTLLREAHHRVVHRIRHQVVALHLVQVGHHDLQVRQALVADHDVRLCYLQGEEIA